MGDGSADQGHASAEPRLSSDWITCESPKIERSASDAGIRSFETENGLSAVREAKIGGVTRPALPLPFLRLVVKQSRVGDVAVAHPGWQASHTHLRWSKSNDHSPLGCIGEDGSFHQ